ncbi:MAG: DoxX family protein [Qingshengfaniella sp.]
MMLAHIRRLNSLLSRIPLDVVRLMLRVFPAMVFFTSGRTKVEGVFSIKESTWFLFEHEYALPLIPSSFAAIMATTAEHVLPILLILGLGTRLSTLGLLGITLVIQIFVYPGAWVTHGLWVSALPALITLGPGTLSLDRLLGLEGPAGGRVCTKPSTA